MIGIVYTEKGAGLHAAVRAAGHSLRQENGTWIADDINAVQAIIDGFDAKASAIAQVKSDIDSYAAKIRNKVTAGVSPAEMAKWATKYEQSQTYIVSSIDADAPDVVAEAAKRGITTLALANKVIANGDQLTWLEKEIAGNAGKHRDGVSATADYQAALAYDWSAGWPVV